MKKHELREAVEANKNETKDALQTIVDQLNKGQKQKIMKVEAVAELLNRYGVEVET